MTTRAEDFEYEGLGQYIKEMEAWFSAELVSAYHAAVLPDGRWRLAMGVIVYGSYVDRFLRLCVPSLLAPGNLDALDDPLIIVHTDSASAERLRAELAALPARVEVHIVPDHIIAMVADNPANKYWLLGGAGHLHMQQAKYRAHAYHMLMPDHIYGTGYFANLRRLARDKEVIVQGALSAVLEDAEPILVGRSCAMAPEELNALALDHLHQQIRPFVMNDRDDMPANIFLIFVGEREAHIVSPHMSLVYMSHAALMKAPIRIFNTLDAQIPYYCGDQEPYMPVPDDGMAYIELSTTDKKYRPTASYTLDQFAAHFWVMTYCNAKFLRVFGLTTRLAFPPGYVPPFQPMSGPVIEARKYAIRARIKDSRETVLALLPDQWRADPLDRINSKAAA